MFFSVKTSVEADYLTVARKFDKDLFIELNPPFPPVKILRYDGNHVGNEVHIELNFLLFRQVWISRITDEFSGEDEIFFIDEGEGKNLPFFLKSWRHKHRIHKNANHTLIIDEVTFKTPFFLFDFLMFPVLYLQFLYRTPIYKRYFKQS